jgi:hypothetical protein
MRIASVLSFVVMSQSRRHPESRACATTAVEERDAGTGAAVRRDDRDELGVTVFFEPQRAADRVAVELDEVPVEDGRILDEPALAHDALGGERTGNRLGDPRSVVVGDPAQLHPISAAHPRSLDRTGLQ